MQINEMSLMLEAKKKAPAKPATIEPKKEKGVRWHSGELRLFTNSLAGLLAGGVPILKALRVTARGSKRKPFRPAIEEIQDQIQNGGSLSEAMEQLRGIFPGFYVQMVRAGERSGTLDHVLSELSTHLEKEAETQRKIREALAYPCLVLITGFVTLFVLLKFVLPKITMVYEGFSTELPWMTKLTLAVSDAFGPVILVLAAAACLVLMTFRKNKEALIKLLFKMPFVGNLFGMRTLHQFASMLALLLQSGIPILEAMKLVGKGSSLAFIERDLSGVREDLAQGTPLGSALESVSWVGDHALALIASGEESGRLPESLGKIAKESMRELESRIQFLVKLLEPGMILGVGLVVGFIVLSALLPVFELNMLAGG